MVKFTFGCNNPNLQYVQITATFDTSDDLTQILLPSWRPGRYELANFAKNIRNFRVFDDSNSLLVIKKLTKDSWEVPTENTSNIRVEYNFYANELNAGSTFLDDTQLYVNPVNCCVYTEATYSEQVEVELHIPSAWDVATSLEKREGNWYADNSEEFLDTPFIASSMLQHQLYESAGVLFHVWFNGEVKPEWDRLIKDFKAFTDLQIARFTEFPVKEYHFLNQILPIKAYHGVEHQKSTVISLGPSYEVFKSLYVELLGVSSHELYHTWNVKAIRPIEMYPYKFREENYSKLGYICEGVTTYQGDLMLYKSGVYDEKQYLKELTQQVQRHFDNPGRFHYSVADSSLDTWLDGYVAGAPGRKVSIYTEGCLLAFCTDVIISNSSDGKNGLDTVMRRLYFDIALKGKGVSEKDYQAAIEESAGISFQNFFDDYINGTRPYESILIDCLESIGLDLGHVPSSKYSEGRLGFKVVKSGNEFKVAATYPGGPAEMGGLVLGDKITGVNGYSCEGELNKWLDYFDDEIKMLSVNRGGKLLTIELPVLDRNFYMTYTVRKTEKPDTNQVRAFDKWKR
ncbi:MAG: PDZ domain-containing protein [Crocinitomicaceae bacterium]|nr:PDZ domain-containing protein [Crocinitomicaceae bacterium]